MAYSVFGVDEGIVDSHNIDLTMLHAVTVIRKAVGHGQIDDRQERTHCGRPKVHVSASASSSGPGVVVLTHETTDAAEAVDADFGNHGRGLWSWKVGVSYTGQVRR